MNSGDEGGSLGAEHLDHDVRILTSDRGEYVVAPHRTVAHRSIDGLEGAGRKSYVGQAGAERAAIFRAIESAARVRSPEIPMERRLASFDEVEHAPPHPDAAREARRCLSCGCRKADCCLVRCLATEYDVQVYRFAGQRHRFSQDLSHPEIVYEPGRCVSCDAASASPRRRAKSLAWR